MSTRLAPLGFKVRSGGGFAERLLAIVDDLRLATIASETADSTENAATARACTVLRLLEEEAALFLELEAVPGEERWPSLEALLRLDDCTRAKSFHGGVTLKVRFFATAQLLSARRARLAFGAGRPAQGAYDAMRAFANRFERAIAIEGAAPSVAASDRGKTGGRHSLPEDQAARRRALFEALARDGRRRSLAAAARIVAKREGNGTTGESLERWIRNDCRKRGTPPPDFGRTKRPRASKHSNDATVAGGPSPVRGR